jgi:hypothetical protein
MNPRNLFTELKRRNVIRAAILHLGAVWALAQGLSQLGPSVGAPEWTTRWFLVAAGIGFPLWIAFAWFYEFTPEGLKRESEIDRAESITHHTGRKLDFAIMGVLAVAVVLLLTDRFVLRHGVNETTAMQIPEKSIAVRGTPAPVPGGSGRTFSGSCNPRSGGFRSTIPGLGTQTFCQGGAAVWEDWDAVNHTNFIYVRHA